MADIGSSMFFKMLLMVTMTFISAAIGEESFTVIKQEEKSVFEEDISVDIGSTSDFDSETTEDGFGVGFRNVIKVPTKSCRPDEQLDHYGNCKKVC